LRRDRFKVCRAGADEEVFGRVAREVAMRALLLLAAWGLLSLLGGCNQQEMIRDAEGPNKTPPSHFSEPIWR
jgi:hypothetical protein